MSTDRRSFLKSSIATGLALGFPAIAPAQRDKVYRTALIGSGWWGTNILREAAASGRCKIVALVDVDRRQLDKCATEVAKWVSDKPKLYEDYREMLEKEKPEIAIVATPDHWHPLAMIDAVKAGAHVYVEKPISHTILEGRRWSRRPETPIASSRWGRTAASRRTTSPAGSSCRRERPGRSGWSAVLCCTAAMARSSRERMLSRRRS